MNADVGIALERGPENGEHRAVLRISRGAATETIELDEASLARLIAEAGSALHVRTLRAMRLHSQSEFITRRGCAAKPRRA